MKAMMTLTPHLNLIVGWLGILLGFLTGLALGMCFHREGWLGGYTSHQRRLYRLGHISLAALGMVNLLFWTTVNAVPVASPLVAVAGWALIVGAISMPLCCVLMAHWPRTRLFFAVPVLSLIAGAALTLTVLVWPDAYSQARNTVVMASHHYRQPCQSGDSQQPPPGPWRPQPF